MPKVKRVAYARPQPHSSIEPHRLGLPKARIRRVIHGEASAIADVEAETEVKTTLSAPCRDLMRWSAAAVVSSASSQLIRRQPGSGWPLGRVRFIG